MEQQTPPTPPFPHPPNVSHSGASSSTGFDQIDNGDANFVIQPQAQGDGDTGSDEGYYGYADSDASSFLSSVLSEVRRGVEIAGRIYPAHGRHGYGMPMDEEENDRNDLQHHKFTLLLSDKLYAAPIPDEQLSQHNSRILDIGTGTGIWAMDMADKFPNAHVTGVDIAPTQPSFVPPNCFFEIDDIEADWPYQPDHFDFVHGRDLLTAIRDWPRLMEQAYEHLKPGGWIQLASTIPDIQSDDNTLPENSYYLEAGRLYFEMAEKMGSPLDSPRKWSEQMRDAGFTDIRDVIYKIPMGTWPKSRRLRIVGRLEQMMLVEGFEAFMLRGYVEILGGREDDLAFILAHARREITDPSIHTPWHLHTAWKRDHKSRSDQLGIDSLRSKLSKILEDRTREKLPEIIRKLKRKVENIRGDLDKLGTSRETLDQKQIFIMKIGSIFHGITRDAINAQYQGDFSNEPRRRFFADLQRQNDKFVHWMYGWGHTYEDKDSPAQRDSAAPILKNSSSPLSDPIIISREQFINVVQRVQNDWRGNEPEGIPNSMHLTLVFREQSSRWRQIAETHLENVWTTTRNFLCNAAYYAAGPSNNHTAAALIHHVIDPEMKSKRTAVFVKLDEILRPFEEFPIMTRDPELLFKRCELYIKLNEDTGKSLVTHALSLLQRPASSPAACPFHTCLFSSGLPIPQRSALPPAASPFPSGLPISQRPVTDDSPGHLRSLHLTLGAIRSIRNLCFCHFQLFQTEFPQKNNKEAAQEYDNFGGALMLSLALKLGKAVGTLLANVVLAMGCILS